MYLQPCNWREYDNKFKYVVDVYGRTHEGDITRVRITDFKPYFYLRALPTETAAQVANLLSSLKTSKGRSVEGIKIEAENKLDAMRGFNGLQKISVWKLSFPALWAYKHIASELKKKRNVEDIFESNLPPYLRLFHERDLSPASPFKFDGEVDNADENERVDIAYKVQYSKVEAHTKINIPLYVLSYDIEVYSASGNFPVSSNREDEIIQIGMSFRWTDDLMTPVERYVLISGTCEPSGTDVKYISCRNEQDLLIKFKDYIHAEDPDMIVGYNTFGFDDSYIADRCELHRIELQLGRTDTKQWGTRSEMAKTEKKTFELASGKYAVRYFDIPGRLPIDLLLSIRREQNLDSYKLDNVASVFLRDKVTRIEGNEVHTKSTRGLFVGNYIRFDIVTNTVNPYNEGQKFIVTEVKPKSFTVESDSPILSDISAEHRSKLEWSFSKDDVSAQEMFELHRKKAADRSKIAKYCIQDCDLVLTLMAKMDTLVNARGMADVCRVPIDFIFLRGQGIKIYSAVAYNASKRGQIIMAQESVDGDMSYEGAVVLPPKIGMYLEDPIPVLDFNSLYPSNMIAFNISPDSLVYVKTFNQDGRKIHHEGADGSELEKLKETYKIDEISFDTKNDDGEVIGCKTCGYAQPTYLLQSFGHSLVIALPSGYPMLHQIYLLQ